MILEALGQFVYVLSSDLRRPTLGKEEREREKERERGRERERESIDEQIEMFEILKGPFFTHTTYKCNPN